MLSYYTEGTVIPRSLHEGQGSQYAHILIRNVYKISLVVTFEMMMWIENFGYRVLEDAGKHQRKKNRQTVRCGLDENIHKQYTPRLTAQTNKSKN